MTLNIICKNTTDLDLEDLNVNWDWEIEFNFGKIIISNPGWWSEKDWISLANGKQPKPTMETFKIGSMLDNKLNNITLTTDGSTIEILGSGFSFKIPLEKISPKLENAIKEAHKQELIFADDN